MNRMEAFPVPTIGGNKIEDSDSRSPEVGEKTREIMERSREKRLAWADGALVAIKRRISGNEVKEA